MAKFIRNPNFKVSVVKAYTDFVYELFYLMQLIINTPRYWDGWETSDPFRDIVDTGALRDSGNVEKVSQYSSKISWVTEYVGFVYFGYTLRSGRRIPARKWAEITEEENDLYALWLAILIEHLG